MAKKIVLVDSNVFIRAFRKDSIAISKLEKLKGRIGISIITAMELYQGCDLKKMKQLKLQLDVYSTVNISSKTMMKALELIKTHRKNGLMIPDAIIAASALENNLELETFNMKDFSYIKGLKIYRGK